MPITTAVVGRQPIIDRTHRIIGYELLFRPLLTSTTADDPSAPPAPDGDHMTVGVFFSALGIGLERLTGGKEIFCNLDRGVLTGRLPMTLPRRNTIVEVLESVAFDDEVAAGCRRLRASGYRLAADDFRWRDDAEELLGQVDIVKIDIQATPAEEVADLVRRCRPYGVRLLAEKVEDGEELFRCCELGFDLFQGYYLGRPQTVSSPALNPAQHHVLQLAGVVLRPTTDFGEIERIVRTDPALSYQLIQLASLGRFGETRREVRSIREALVLMGEQRLRGWVPALMLRPAGPAIDTHLVTVLARARTVELLAARSDELDSAAGFTAGMLSAFDLLLNIPRERLADTLEIPPSLRADAFGHDTPLARLIAEVIDREHGSFDAAADEPDTADLATADLTFNEVAAEAFGWAVEAATTIDEATGSVPAGG